MELKDFIAESVKQILAGVREAQSGIDGEHINAKLNGSHNLGGNLIDAGRLGVISRVDFDVQVAAEMTGGGGAKLTVLGFFSAEGSGSQVSKLANKIAFSIPVLLPQGGEGEAIRANHERTEDMRKTNEGLARIAERLNRE